MPPEGRRGATTRGSGRRCRRAGSRGGKGGPVTPEEAARAVLDAGESADGLAALPGADLVQWKRGRAVLRMRCGDRRVFVKRFAPSRGEEGRAETDALRRLAVTGVPVASLLAVAEGERGARALVLEDAGPGLDEVAALEGARPEKLRFRLSRAARTVHALHGAGFTFPDLLARHLRVGADGEVRLIDVARLRGPGRTNAAKRAVDLGALFGTLPRLAVPERARLRFFREIACDLTRGERRSLALRTVKETRKTRLRTRNRRGLVEFAPAALGVLTGLAPGAAGFEFWFEGEPGKRLRRLPDRENRRLEVDGRVFFLKRHFRRSRAGVRELEAALEFRRAGAPAALPAAYGEDFDRGSFWLAEQAPGEPLDDLLSGGGVPAAARRELARLLGRHAARLRRAGLFHRDLYLNHWIGRWTREGGWELALIDLQRAGRTGLRAERWFVKDAAQLWHSARRTPLTRTDGMRFLRACFSVARLGPREKTFARRVLRKSASMAARRPRTPTSDGAA